MSPQNDPRSQADQKSITRTGETQRRESSLSSSPRSGYQQQSRGEYPYALGGFDSSRGGSNPFSLMRRMSEEMDRLFQNFGQNFGIESGGYEGGGQGREGYGWSPAVEVTQREGKLIVQCELPGVSANDVKVEITNDALILEGERRSEREQNDRGIQRSERQYGAFSRTIPLPEGANIDQATARCENGVLEVSIPVPQQREERRSIPIQTTGAQAGQTTETRRQAA